MSFIRKKIDTTQSFEVEIKIHQEDIIRYIEKSDANDFELIEIIMVSKKQLSEDVEYIFKVETLEDEQKIKILQEVYKKYSLTQLVTKLQL